MAQQYDPTLKHILEAYAADWLGWLGPRLGFPSTVTVEESLDVDLSTVQVIADKAFRLGPPASGILHIEPQANWDVTLPQRLLVYNALLENRYGGPVYTVALLLRREANASSLTGTLVRSYPDGREYLRFSYPVIRVWELAADDLLKSGPGAVPLALLTDDARPRLAELVKKTDENLRTAGVASAIRNDLWASSFILLGMRYDEAMVKAALAGVHEMKESTTYQAIFREGKDEGRVEGRVEEAQNNLLVAIEGKFGFVPSAIAERIRLITDIDRIRAAIRQLFKVASPDELVI